MDVTILTSDPEAIDAAAIEQALYELGYFVASVEVVERPL